MMNRFSGKRVIPVIFWILAFAAIPIWIRTDPPAWDLHIYMNAMHALEAGHDPYADGIAVQEIFHDQQVQHLNVAPPYTYVYSPITLPLLRWIGAIPGWFSGAVFWLLYVVGVLSQIGVGMQASKPREWKYFVFLAPAAAFFPGLLVQDNILSGNIVYILYGLILASALIGWRRGQWRWFYLVTLAASCCKAPLLSLLPIPILSARRQWLPACITLVAGVGLFAMQPHIWPSLFRNYLQAVSLQFSYNHDFGFSPAGLFGHLMAYLGQPYSTPSMVFYLFYALPLFALLYYLSRRFLAGRFTLEQWMPVMLLGVILLNPRIMTYDVAPLTIPMALIVWRFLTAFFSKGRAMAVSAVLFVVTNAIVLSFPDVNVWKVTEGALLVAVFAAGCWNLLRLQDDALRHTKVDPVR